MFYIIAAEAIATEFAMISGLPLLEVGGVGMKLWPSVFSLHSAELLAIVYTGDAVMLEPITCVFELRDTILQQQGRS